LRAPELLARAPGSRAGVCIDGHLVAERQRGCFHLSSQGAIFELHQIA